MRDVIWGTCNQVVYGNDPKSLVDKTIAQMRAEKSGSTRNDSNLFRKTRSEHSISEKLN